MTHLLSPTERLRQRVREAWTPRPRTALSALAEQYLHLSTEYANEPGRIRFSRTPYAKEPLDRLHPDDPTQIIVLEWGVQLAKTTVAQCWMHGVMGAYPAPMVVVFDTYGKAEEFSKHRLDLMIRDSALLQGRVADPKSRSKDASTIKIKQFPGGLLKIAGAQSAADLQSTPFKYAVVDEVDSHRANVGKLGSSVALVLGRQTTFGDAAKTLLVSSPSVDGSSEIHSWFERGDQRYFWVPCVHCGEYQILQWKDEKSGDYNLRWDKGKPETAMYFCVHCGTGMENHDKNQFLPQGEWRPSRPDMGENGKISSYHLNSLYSPHGMLSWEKLARQWEQATAAAKRGAIDELRTFVNSRLAQVFTEPGEVLDADSLASRTESDWMYLPDAVTLIVGAVDVQDDRIEVLILGVGRGYEMWVLDYYVIHSDPLAHETWLDLDEVFAQSYEKADGSVMLVTRTLLDTGYKTQQVHDYCNGRRKRH